jgi:hypothetical protein
LIKNILFEKLITPKRKVSNESSEALSSWTLMCNIRELKHPWSVLKGFTMIKVQLQYFYWFSELCPPSSSPNTT